MLTYFQTLVRECRPISICQMDALAGSRIGGNAPEGVEPDAIYATTRYLATIMLDESQAMSIFLSFDYDEDSPNSLWKNSSTLHFHEQHLVQFVFHKPADRSRSRSLCSELEGRALKVLAIQPDIVVAPKGPLVLPNKLGGRPYFFSDASDYHHEIERIFDEGFSMLLQLTCPGFSEAPKGDWPFFEYSFHLFFQECHDGLLLRYGWG